MSIRPSARPTVLLVDDDAALRAAVSFRLETEGFAVSSFESGEALLAGKLPRANACLVVDNHLGAGISGMEALEKLRRRGVRLPAVVITSGPPPALRIRATNAGAAMIEKPLLGDNLLTAIKALV